MLCGSGHVGERRPRESCQPYLSCLGLGRLPGGLCRERRGPGLPDGTDERGKRGAMPSPAGGTRKQRCPKGTAGHVGSHETGPRGPRGPACCHRGFTASRTLLGGSEGRGMNQPRAGGTESSLGWEPGFGHKCNEFGCALRSPSLAASCILPSSGLERNPSRLRAGLLNLVRRGTPLGKCRLSAFPRFLTMEKYWSDSSSAKSSERERPKQGDATDS